MESRGSTPAFLALLADALERRRLRVEVAECCFDGCGVDESPDSNFLIGPDHPHMSLLSSEPMTRTPADDTAPKNHGHDDQNQEESGQAQQVDAPDTDLKDAPHVDVSRGGAGADEDEYSEESGSEDEGESASSEEEEGEEDEYSEECSSEGSADEYADAEGSEAELSCASDAESSEYSGEDDSAEEDEASPSHDMVVDDAEGQAGDKICGDDVHGKGEDAGEASLEASAGETEAAANVQGARDEGKAAESLADAGDSPDSSPPREEAAHDALHLQDSVVASIEDILQPSSRCPCSGRRFFGHGFRLVRWCHHVQAIKSLMYKYLP